METREIDLRRCVVDEKDVDRVARKAGEGDELLVLRCDNCEFAANKAFNRLLSVLPKERCIEINLWGAQLQDDALLPLAQYIGASVVRTLRMSSALGKQAEPFFQSLFQSTSLRYLRIVVDNDSQVLALSKGLMLSTSLVSLRLPLSPMGNAGAAALCTALRDHPAIESVVLKDCTLSEYAIRCFGRLVALSNVRIKLDCEIGTNFTALHESYLSGGSDQAIRRLGGLKSFKRSGTIHSSLIEMWQTCSLLGHALPSMTPLLGASARSRHLSGSQDDVAKAEKRLARAYLRICLE